MNTYKTDLLDLRLGDCLDLMRAMPDNSVDSVVTDPPYGLSFMGKAWDKGVPSCDVWKEALRVLRPGGHLLAFAGTRTQHRMACAIEDAGFEIRDMIAWVYGSGFPKSLDVSKAIDKTNGEAGRLHKFTAWMRTTGLKSSEINRITETNMGGHYLTSASQPAIPTAALWEKLRPHCGDVPEWVDELVQRIEAEREVVGKHSTDMGGLGGQRLGQAGGDITAPATEAAQQWDGWGTALKPALEPITVARKPLAKGNTVAKNVLEHGTGAINVDGCRVGTESITVKGGSKSGNGFAFCANYKEVNQTNTGRFPANLIHDGSQQVLDLFPNTKSGTISPHHQRTTDGGNGNTHGKMAGVLGASFGDSGSAARFFYQAKASKKDRDEGCEGFEVQRTGAMQATADGSMMTGSGNERTTSRANHHPTVKPTDLMRYLCRLVTPPNGTVLDPFMGSGSTGKAAVLEGFHFIGCELDAEYIEIAKARIGAVKRETTQQAFL